MPSSPQASARIRRLSLFLSAYEYNLKFRDTLSHSNAGALSRLPLAKVPPEIDTPPEVILLMEHLCNSTVTAHNIQAAMQKDPLLSKVLYYVRRGWPDINTGGADLSPYFTWRAEFSLQD